MRRLLFSIFLFPFSSLLYAQGFSDTKTSVEDKVNSLLSQMTLEEKIDYIAGIEGMCIRPIERLRLPRIVMSDGPIGVRSYGQATAYPAGIATAATWDTTLVDQLGHALGRDARARDVHILLAPGVNIYRAPMCGRNFEYFGEDPYLVSRMAVNYIRGVQGGHVVATVKHFAGNNQEWARHTTSSDMDERTLQDTYPSWLYPVKMGATTIWERWNAIKPDSSFANVGMSSFNHYSYWAIGDWMYRVMAGIDTDDSLTGYKKIIIQPHPGGGFTYVNAQLITGYGKVSSRWKNENGLFSLDVDIPANTSAVIRMPDNKSYEVGSGKYHFESK